MKGLIKNVVACGSTWVPAKLAFTIPAKACTAMKGLKWMLSCGCNGVLGGPRSLATKGTRAWHERAQKCGGMLMYLGACKVKLYPSGGSSYCHEWAQMDDFMWV
jgi:hypothetical protein